jgi:hypothetical protein
MWRTFLNQPFNYLQTPKAKYNYVLFSTAFALIFIVVFQPYGISEEVASPVNPLDHIVYFFLAITISTFLGLTLSQFILRRLFKVQEVAVKEYIGWFLLEGIIITLFYFALSFLIPDLGNDFESELNLTFQLKNYMRAQIVLLFPFFACILFEQVTNLNAEIKELEQQLKAYTKTAYKKHKLEQVLFKDENGKEYIKIQLEQFLYAESSNQYLLIHYLENGNYKKQIIRNRLKNVINEMNSLPIKRCHRSYMVNLMQVNYMQKIANTNYLIINKGTRISIPVSKTYLHSIKQEIIQQPTV